MNEQKYTSGTTEKIDLLFTANRGNMPSIEVDTSTSQPLEKRCYTVEEIQVILSCGRETVYALLKRHEFPWFRLGGNRGPYRISRKGFDDWLDHYSQ